MQGARTRYNLALEEKRRDDQTKKSVTEAMKRKSQALAEVREEENRAKAALDAAVKRRKMIDSGKYD